MKDMTKGNEWVEIFFFTIPLLIGNVFQQLYIIIDSVVVGHFLGKQALGAIGATMPIIFMLVSLVMGLSIGASVVISQFFGAKKMAEVKRTIDTTYIALFVASILCSIGGPLFSKSILVFMHTPADILPQAKVFIDVFFYGITLTFGYNTVSAVLRALGDSKTPMFYLVLSTVLNSVLVLLFVLVFHWGIAGSALATVCAQGFSFLGLIWHVNRRENLLLHIRPLAMRFDLEIFKKIMLVGLPAGLQQLFVSLGMMAVIRLVNNYGTDMIAGFTAATRLDMFALMPAMNLSLAMSTFIGQNIGANKMQRVKKGLRVGLVFSALFSLFVTAIIYLYGASMMTIFTGDQVVIQNGARYLHLTAAFYIIFSLMFVYGGFFRGAGDTIMPLIFTILAMWVVRVPVAKMLSVHIGIDGVWWSFGIGWSVGCLLSMGYYFTGIWKKYKVVPANAA